MGLSVAITCFWAFWGAIETFHEGWHFASFWQNVGLSVAQYLSPMLLFLVVTVCAVAWPRIGAVLHGLLAALILWFFRGNNMTANLLLMLPLLLLGGLHWFGRPRPRRVALALIMITPLAVLIGFGMGPALRVSQRVHDGDLGLRVVSGNGVRLAWAPDGPGWPQAGTDWHSAGYACACLRDDGMSMAESPVHVWRLPSVDEVVRSMALHGENSRGVWDAERERAVYDLRPDKESPLWNVHSPVIYWWTETEASETHAYIAVYDGGVWKRDKTFSPTYLGYRCVRSMEDKAAP